MSTKKTILQFPNLYLLWNFAQTLRASSIEINTNKRTLICQCTEQDVTTAIEKFRAEVVQVLQENAN